AGPGGNRYHDRVRRPARTAKIRRSRNLDMSPVTLIGVHGPGMIDTTEPFEQQQIPVPWSQTQVTLSYGNPCGHFSKCNDLLKLKEALLNALSDLHQFRPSPIWIPLVTKAGECSLPLPRCLLHHVDRYIVEPVASPLEQFVG